MGHTAKKTQPYLFKKKKSQTKLGKYYFTYMKYLEQPNSQRQKIEQQLPESRGKREWELLDTGFHFDEKFLEVGYGDGCTKMGKYLMPQNCMQKMVKMETFVLCALYHN